MAERKRAKTGEAPEGFSEAEQAAMKERAREIQAEKAPGKRSKKDPEAEVLAKIAEMPDADRAMAERIHAIVKESAPDLVPRTWYGMPAYSKDGKVVCFFQAASKFDARYATFGFDEKANLDEGSMWPTSFALTKLTADGEKKLAELIKKAAS